MIDHTFWNEGTADFPVVQRQEFMPLGLSARWVKADMVLGNAHAGCRGAGICKISVQGQRSAFSRCGCEYIPVLLTHVNKHCVGVLIDKQDLGYAQRIKHFYKKKTAIHKAIPLPHQLHVGLGFQTKIGVDAQVVDVHEDKYVYRFFVDVSSIIV